MAWKEKWTKHGRNAILKTVYWLPDKDADKVRRVAGELDRNLNDWKQNNPRLALELVANVATKLIKNWAQITVNLLRKESGLKD